MNNTFYKKYTQQILFGLLITFYLFIFYIYSLEQCYPRIGFAGVYGICIGIGFLFILPGGLVAFGIMTGLRRKKQ